MRVPTAPSARLARAAVIAIAIATPFATTPAAGATLRDLAGWWLAIDDTYPKLWQRGGVAVVEEVLVLNADGRTEDRVMNFWSGSAQDCAETKVCTDLPLVAAARLALKGDKLAVGGRGDMAGRLDPKGDGAVRKLAVTSTPNWTFALKGRELSLTAAGAARTFVRIEPDRLRRLRAGMRVSGHPADKHWRCFLGNATARDAAFASVRSAKSAAPAFLEPYLRAASYLATLNSMIRRPTPDDPEGRKLIGFDTEEFLVEEFPDIRLPVAIADKRELQMKITYLERRVHGDNAAAASSAASAAVSALAGGAPVKTALGEAEIAALGRVMNDDAEAKKLFCR
jgi:hypothetical protein